MSDTAPKRVYRVTGNARRVIAPVVVLAMVLCVVIFIGFATDHISDWRWRAAAVAFVLIFWWGSKSDWVSRFIRSLSDRAVKNDFAWAVVSTVLRNFRRLRAVFIRIFDTAPFRLLGYLVLPLGIVLTAAMSYRAVAIFALLSQESTGSGVEAASLALDWLLFGLGYGAIGIAAPVVTLLLLVRRRRSTLGIAMALQILAVFGVSVAYLRITLGAIWGAPEPDAAIEHLLHPVFAEPQATAYVMKLLFCEFLASAIAIFVLSRSSVLRHFDDQPAGPDSASNSADGAH